MVVDYYACIEAQALSVLCSQSLCSQSLGLVFLILMEAQKKKEAALKEAAKQAARDTDTQQSNKEYQTTNTLSRKFAKMRDGLIMLAP